MIFIISMFPVLYLFIPFYKIHTYMKYHEQWPAHNITTKMF